MFFLCSCNNVNNSKINGDSEQDKVDSLEEARIDSLALIAWGDLHFGMSLEEARKTKTFKNASRYYKDEYSHKLFKLEGNDYRIDGFSTGSASFFNDKLYEIGFATQWKTASHNKQINKDSYISENVYKLRKLIEKKYGRPTSDFGIPSFFQLKPDRKVKVYGWLIGDKSICIDVGAYGDFKCMVVCSIYNVPMNDAVNEFYRKKLEEEESNQVNGF